MLSKSLAADVLTTALSTGGDFGEIFVEHTKRNSVSLVNGEIDKVLSGVDYGLGLRIFVGYGAVYAYTNDTARENLLKIAREAAAAVRERKNCQNILDFTNIEITNKHIIRELPGKRPKVAVADLLKSASDAAYSYNPLITQTNGSYMDVVQNVLIVNSDGLWAEDQRVRSRFSIGAVASNETEKQTGSYTIGGTKGMELLDEVDPKAFGRQSGESAVTMLKADLCPGGQMPVVIDNGFGGVIFHEACGHSLEATSVAKSASVFAGKLGETIACDKVTAIDDGTIVNAWGSANIDDEGAICRKNILIEKGILKSYMVDRLNGLKMDMAPTGSSRRESYRYAPTSRMTNTYIAAGTDTAADIIASVDYGLYAGKMGGGSVQPATGEFNFAVREGYLIEKGKITTPVRGATLIGKGSEILMDIDMVSDNMAMEPGMCGSISGSIPTNVGQPMVRVKNITVGGRR